MKKKLFLIATLLLPFFIGNSQTPQEVTMLYLLPFHLEETNVSYSSLRSSAEIHQVRPFEMMGFWLGAKMALQEYAETDKKVNVIIRDAVRDEEALHNILNDTLLMKNVNMMIGPVYGSLFPVASEYAKNHDITIINPFSTRYDFVENNPNLYKLVPPFMSRPQAIEEHFLSVPQEYNVILWGDSTTTIELQAYKYYFNKYHIKYKEAHTLTLPLEFRKDNLIIALFDRRERVIHAVHSLINQEEHYNKIIVVPETWLLLSELTEDFYNIPELYFFTNCFVDESRDAVKQFQADYTFFYEAPALLADYVYQGYDITRYFIDLYFAGFDTENLQFQPLSYQFQWQRIENGGLENIKIRLIRVKGLDLEEVR